MRVLTHLMRKCVCAHSLARALFIVVVVFTCSFRDGGGFSREAKEEETKIFSLLSLSLLLNKQTNKQTQDSKVVHDI